MNNLKNCPFCGGQGFLITKIGGVYVQCGSDKCNAQGPQAYTQSLAKILWDSRTQNTGLYSLIANLLKWLFTYMSKKRDKPDESEIKRAKNGHKVVKIDKE